ncbi:MAG TPA: preprotein translocase subunit SecG [Alphaproteobacteria bacterium]|nr:preprotein translocase subunit SecG [Alphaproteobacteria bacterium]
MQAVLITAYLIIVLALIAVILLQRSEGGGLGMGGGSNGLLTVRGSANVLTRTTAILAALFFATAIGLTILTEIERGSNSILQRAADGVGEGGGSPTSVLDALNALQSDESSLPVPTGAPGGAQAPAPAVDDVGSGAANPATDPALAVPSSGTEVPAAEGGEAGTPSAQPDGGTETPAAPVD